MPGPNANGFASQWNIGLSEVGNYIQTSKFYWGPNATYIPLTRVGVSRWG